MALDFPASPTLNQLYPSPAVPGVPVYTWDGEKWAAVAIGNVRYDTAQSLTAPQMIQARQNIYAAPFDAMAYSGMQINGGFDVSQELGNVGPPLVSGTGKYVVDGWTTIFNHATAGFGPVQVAGGVIQNTFFPNLLAINGVAAFTAIQPGNFFQLYQAIEGYRVARLGFGTASAVPLTVSFWVYSKSTGLFSLAVRNGASNRSYVTDVQVNSANTWEYKSVTIPPDTIGTWASDNTVGLFLNFTLACGATYQTAPNVWTAGTFVASTGITNTMFNIPNGLMYFTGVTVLPGNEAPSAARSPFVMRPYDQELVTCRRYWQKISNTAFSSTASNALFPVYFSEMRATPTTINISGGTISNATFVAFVIQNNIGGYFQITTSAGNGSIVGRIDALDARL